MSDGVLVSLIGAGATVVVAIIGIITTWLRLRAAKKNPNALIDPDEEVREAEERFGADPQSFIAELMQDRREYRLEVAGYREEVGALRKELKDFRETDRKFRNALARWFVDIMARFSEHNLTMPYPIEPDREILADVIPSALEATRPRPPV